MGRYVQADAARMWFDEHGEGDTVVLLHPGGVDARAWGPNLSALAERFRVLTPEQRAHGHTADVEGPISYELMAADTAAFLEATADGPVDLVGCSDGAIVALHLALLRPELVRRLVFIGGVFHRDGWAPGVIVPGADPPAFFARMYGELSPDGADHFPVVAAKLDRMHTDEPSLSHDALAELPCRALVMVGDDDEVLLEHAIAMYRAVPDAELAVVPGTSHGLLVEKPELCNAIIISFLAEDPVATLAPIRRRSGAPADL
jgi:pimeloyl-ACP methyl ester carboxylesterase